MNIYVGNLSRDLTETELQQEFAAFGEVTSVSIVRDRGNRVSKGFGFVEMPNKSEADAAVAALKGKIIKERTLDIAEANPKPQKGGGGGRKGFGRRGGARKGGRGRF